jgi:hypothetical protein
MNSMFLPAHEPQSIVHQMIRASKLVKKRVKRYNALPQKSSCYGVYAAPFTATNLPQTSNAVFTRMNETCSSAEDFLAEAIKIAGTDSSDVLEVTREDTDENASISARTSLHESCNDSILKEGNQVDNEDTSIEVPILPLDTINQNDFMIRCIIDTSRPCIIHIFVEDAVASEIVDRELEKLHAVCVKEKARCRFMRLQANAAPFITAKLQVSTQDPSIICIHNGQVFDRMNNLEKLVQHPEQLQQWAHSTGMLDC